MLLRTRLARHTRAAVTSLAVASVLATAAVLVAQPRTTGVTVLSKGARQSLAVTAFDGQEMVAVDELAALFQLTMREDQLAAGITVTRAGKTLVYSAQGLVSSSGRLVQLGAGPRKERRTWFVPVEFLGRGLSLILDQRAEYRRGSRLLVVGDLRVPRVTVRTDTTPTSGRVTIELSPRTEHTLTQENGRLVLGLQADAVDPDIGSIVPNDILAGVRAVETPPGVAIDLGPRFATFRSTDIPVDSASTRIVIDLMPAGAPAGPTSAPTPTTPGAPGAPAEPTAVLPFDAAATGIRTIVIDAGHGGDETGARGPNGTQEKDVTLSVARQLKASIEARLGLRVLMTRDADATVGLDERAALANNNKADLFVSIHANASVSSQASGAEVFYLSLDEYGERARRDAQPEVTSIPGMSGEKQIELLLWDMAQARHLEDSAMLATFVEQQLRARVPMSARAIQQAPFRVLVGANMPAVLVELGFVTNPTEEAKLTSPDHQGRLTQAIYDAIVLFRQYVEGGRKPVAASPGQAAGGPR
jgi:N-acetylmuramoyl-L-alanine amidase